MEGRRKAPSETPQGGGARGLGKATSGLPGRFQVEGENKVQPGGISAMPPWAPGAQRGLEPGRMSLRHQGDERKRRGSRPDDGLQDRMGAVTQLGEGWVMASTSWAAS